MTDWREKLIKQMAKAIEKNQVYNAENWETEARAALAVAEPVIREWCAKKCEGDFDSEMKGYGAYFAAAIREEWSND